MAKLSKLALKVIVKECLIEILQEGLMTDELMTESRPRKPSQKRSSATKKRSRGTSLDNIRFDSRVEANANFEKNVEEAARSLTDDPVLSSILADTAKTTLQEQIGAESRGAPQAGSDRASLEAARSNPEDLFGSAASKWADLAFSDLPDKQASQD